MQQPVLSTSRLVLRALTPADADIIYLLRSDSRVNIYLDRPLQKKPEEATAFIDKIITGTEGGKSFYWGITWAESDQLIGTICIWNISENRLKAEIGYELLPEEQGKGIMREALKAVIDFAFDRAGLRTLEAFTHRANRASENLLRHCGFQLQPNRKGTDNDDLIIFCLQSKNSIPE